MRNVEKTVHVERNFSPLSTGHAAQDASVGRFARRHQPSNLLLATTARRGWGSAGGARARKESMPGKVYRHHVERVGSKDRAG
jgi:hypothetical protein